jgi:MFS transporter, PPP family, 3-phenylpropionic acid transporter
MSQPDIKAMTVPFEPNRIALMTQNSVPIRLSSNIFATFLVIGVYVPFLPVWLKGRGLTSAEIGLIFAAALWAKIPFSLLVSSLADQTGHRKWLLVGVAVITLGGFLAFPFLHGFWAILTGWVIAGTLLTTLIPLADNLAVAAIQRFQVDYGRIRLWGSISFIFVSFAGGAYLESRNSEAVLDLLIGGSAIMVLSALFVPDLRELPRKSSRPALFDLIKMPGFLLFVLSAAILQASHAALYGYATLEWEAAGHSKTVIGMLWAEGVLVEIILFVFSARLARHLGATGLLIAAGLAGIVRWTVLGSTTWLPALIAVQGLHALTFAATLVAAITYITNNVPKDQSATAQGLYDGLAMGFIFGVAMIIAGRAHDQLGSSVFYVMALFSAGGVIGALLLKRRKSV